MHPEVRPLKWYCIISKVNPPDILYITVNNFKSHLPTALKVK